MFYKQVFYSIYRWFVFEYLSKTYMRVDTWKNHTIFVLMNPEKIMRKFYGLNLGCHKLVHSYTKIILSRTTFTIPGFSLLPKTINICETVYKVILNVLLKTQVHNYKMSYTAVSLRKRTSTFLISTRLRKRIWLCLRFIFNFSKLFN